MEMLKLHDVFEGNLKHIDVEIPKHQLTILCGVSGSGKSTLAKDVIYNECQRQYLEAMGFQGIHKPKLERMYNATASVIIQQTSNNKNPRSTLGTITNIYTELRMLFEKLSSYECPHCHQILNASNCKEELEKNGHDFEVYMYCEHCHTRIQKLTRSHFSYNTKEGACPTCKGLGMTLQINEDAVLNKELSLEDGAIDYWKNRYGEYQIANFYKALNYYNIEYQPHQKVKDFSKLALDILLYGVECDSIKQSFSHIPSPKTVMEGKFEGAYTTLYRRLKEHQGHIKEKDLYFKEDLCPDCLGKRLNQQARNAKVNHMTLPQLSKMSLTQLSTWLEQLKPLLTTSQFIQVEAYFNDLNTKIHRLLKVGLGYLQLDRQMITLSGGEIQRVRISSALDSDITDILYILDEPTASLHARDTLGMVQILRQLVDKGNTVLVIEHDMEILRQSDYIIEIGPSAGQYGGEIIFKGTYLQLLKDQNSITAKFLKNKYELPLPKQFQNWLHIKQASKNNLKHIDVDFPINALSGVSGVSGSGKSTLIYEILLKQEQVFYDHPFKQIVSVHQSPITRMNRSNVATFIKAYDKIRQLMKNQPLSKSLNLTEKDFSFNTKGGRCEHCEGLGVVTSNLLFFEDVEVECPICHGKRFNDTVLSVTYNGYNIFDILEMDIDEALALFQSNKPLNKMLTLLQEVGLGYLKLGQPLTTLSGGEGQRLKLARDLLTQNSHNTLFLIDEPTIGLHPKDIEHFISLLKKMVAMKNTVIVIEHNLQLLAQCDYIVDLGKEGGDQGGELIACGDVQTIINNKNSLTGLYLKKEIELHT